MSVFFIMDIVRTTGVFFTAFFVFSKAINYKAVTKHKILSLIWCVVISVLYAFILPYVPQQLILIILTLASILFIFILTRIKISLIISGFLLSFAIGFVLYLLSALMVSSLLWIFWGNMPVKTLYDDIKKLYIVIVFIFQFIIAFAIFKIQRFKNGFPFLLNNYFLILSLLASGIVIILSTLIVSSQGSNYNYSLMAGMIIVGIGIAIWIRRGITMFYKKKMKERTIEILEEQLLEKEELIKNLTAENAVLSAESHKINKRFAALEQIVTVLSLKLSDSKTDSEINMEFPEILQEINRMGEEYRNNINKQQIKKALPTTKIEIIDGIFDYFHAQCMNVNIQFNLKVNGSIHYLVENIIDQSKLETIIGDHIQDAIIAVNASENTFRSILVILGLIGDCYELTIYDSGIEFEIDTLLRLGTERVTTHADSGGSGIGFMTTFETLKDCIASLLIDEKKPSATDYTKSVTIRFDNQNQYLINTYRLKQYPTEINRDIIVNGCEK